MKLTAIIFMGGRASRLGGINKADILVDGTSCKDRVMSALAPHCETIALSVATNAQTYMADTITDLASTPDLDGISNALRTILRWGLSTDCDAIVTSTVDTPFLPKDFVPRLVQVNAKQAGSARPTVSGSGGCIHPLHALWPRDCFSPVIDLIERQGIRSINRLHKTLGSMQVKFDITPFDPFLNINTPEDLRRAIEIAQTASRD